MSWRDILGVGDDATLKDCKRAYAKLIKVVRPDEQPEEFIAIRNAYESAQNYFSRNVEQPVFTPSKTKKEKTVPKFESSVNPIEVFIETPEEDELEETGEIEETIETIVYENEMNSSTVEDKLCEKLSIFYQDINKRFSIGAWQQFINDLNLKEEEIFKHVLAHFANDNYELSDEIWAFLSKTHDYIDLDCFTMKHRIDYPTNFDFTIEIHDRLHKQEYFESRNQLYYQMLDLETHNEDKIIYILQKYKYILVEDRFFYELLLKRLVERQIYDDIIAFEPNKDKHADCFNLHQNYLGYYFNSMDRHEEALKYFNDYDGFEKLGQFESLLALGQIKQAKSKSIALSGRKHLLSSHFNYKKSRRRKLQSESIIKRVAKEKSSETWAVILLVLLILAIVGACLFGGVVFIWNKARIIAYMIIGFVVYKILKKFGKR